ncbi:MAG: DUF3108 domain-containing protein [Steroidobacteraceae bacterium]|jgi:hypothetical protein
MAACIAATSLAVAAPPARSTDMPAAAASTGPEPFAAHYVAEWHDISVGVSDLQLQRDSQPGQYHYTWTISARGIFRLAYSHDVTQQSWFGVVDDHVRPKRYRGEEGSSFVAFEFDWETGHAFGSSEGKPIDLVLKPGTQDLMSIQVEVMLDLKNGNLPPIFHIIDKDQIKEFLYTREGTEKLRTAIGMLDTVVVASRHGPTDSRVLRMWFAPDLGYVPVQAERRRDGKLEFAMRIRTLQR